MAFDVARIRGQFPALGDGWIHLDGVRGMLTPEQVASAVSSAVRAPLAGPGAAFPASARAENIAVAARRAVADLTGGDPAGVVLGPNAAVLVSRLADVLGQQWKMGDEVVVSRLDEESNIASWKRAAKRVGAIVHWGEIDIETCELPAWQYDNLITERTKVVAVTAGSGSVGTRPDVATVASFAKKTSALTVVDASYAAPCTPIRFDGLGADVIVLSGRAWGGPEAGALVFRDPELLARLPSIALEPQARGPERLELGPHSYPQLAGLAASVDYLASLDDAATGARAERITAALRSLGEYHAELLEQLHAELAELPHVSLIGNPRSRIPTLAFAVRGRKAAEVAKYLASRGICAFADDGTGGVFGSLGVAEVGGAVCVALAHYTNMFEINRLVRALTDLR